MVHYSLDDKDNILASLCQQIKTNLPENRATELIGFAEVYYASASVSDLMEWNLEDLYGSTLACWQFIQQRKREQPKIRVFNPDYEQHGWQSTHTIIARGPGICAATSNRSRRAPGSLNGSRF